MSKVKYAWCRMQMIYSLGLPLDSDMDIMLIVSGRKIGKEITLEM